MGEVVSAPADIAGVDAALIVDAVFRRASMCMAITDQSGTYLQVNDALCKYLGYSAIELNGKSFRDVTAPDDLAYGAMAMESLINGHSDDFAVRAALVVLCSTSCLRREPGATLLCVVKGLFAGFGQTSDGPLG